VSLVNLIYRIDNLYLFPVSCQLPSSPGCCVGGPGDGGFTEFLAVSPSNFVHNPAKKAGETGRNSYIRVLPAELEGITSKTRLPGHQTGKAAVFGGRDGDGADSCRSLTIQNDPDRPEHRSQQNPQQSGEPNRGRFPKVCVGCGCTFMAERVRRKFCSRSCSGRQILRPVHFTPESTKQERSRANGLINQRVRRKALIVPLTCEQCGKSCRPDAHHDDYSQPDKVRWLCLSCHAIAHLSPFPPRKYVTPRYEKLPPRTKGGES
jgi:hypothetical protein